LLVELWVLEISETLYHRREREKTKSKIQKRKRRKEEKKREKEKEIGEGESGKIKFRQDLHCLIILLKSYA
jgi:sRNA-binding protein